MRGKTAKLGQTRVAKNGYHYTRCEGGWRLTHHLIVEKKLGRPINSNEERVYFKDGDRTNLESDNIEVVLKGTKSLTRRKAELEYQIEQLQVELESISKTIENTASESQLI